MTKRIAKTWAQTALLCGFWFAAESISTAFHWPIPGSVVGLVALLALLELRPASLAWVVRGADFLLGHLMLFFVPAMLGLLSHPELKSLLGLKLLVAVIVGTLAVMCGTALVVEIAFRFTAGRNKAEREGR